MTQKNNKVDAYKKSIVDNLETITGRFISYLAVDATLSENTLMKVNAYLRAADRCLESGFVKDACNEIEEQLLKEL